MRIVAFNHCCHEIAVHNHGRTTLVAKFACAHGMAEDEVNNQSALVDLLLEHSAIVSAGGFWNCLAAARAIAALLLSGGRSPWLARLRKTSIVNGQTFHWPLIPRRADVHAAWTTHYVCCCDGLAFDPLAETPIELAKYTQEVFGESIYLEVFVAEDALPSYLGSV
jgi:hypothetical protein